MRQSRARGQVFFSDVMMSVLNSFPPNFSTSTSYIGAVPTFHECGEPPSAAEATISHQWWTSAATDDHWFRSVSCTSMAWWPLVTTSTDR